MQPWVIWRTARPVLALHTEASRLLGLPSPESQAARRMVSSDAS
jgi:hypothetical protein